LNSAGLEIAAIFLRRHRQGRDQPRPQGERHARHQTIGALRQSGEHDDRSLGVVLQIVRAQGGNDARDLRLEPGHVRLAQVAMPGNADHKRQAVG